MKMILPLIALVSFILSDFGFAEEMKTESSYLEMEITKKISTLGPDINFTYVDLGITEAEWLLIEKLKFDNIDDGTRQYSRFGKLHLLKGELPTFLREIGNDDEQVIEAVTETISRIAYDIVKGSNKESAWICVRASTPNPEFDTPRWHIDGQYYGIHGPYPYPEIVFKFAAVLKGPPTLLYNLSADAREIFNSNWNDRNFLSKLLDLNQAESPKKGQGVLFVVADQKIGGVHSEPKMDENRLFFSILIGNESEIDELYSRWHPNKN